MIIGITGLYASGKDLVAEFLTQKNFFQINFADEIKKELKKNKQKINRENLIEKGKELREKYGPTILAKMALDQVQDGENYVFTTIRNVEEVKLLQQKEDFLLVNIVAPENVRFRRILQRKLDNDPKTLKELRKKESLEKSSDTNGQQLHLVTKMAKVTMNNNSNVKKLQEKVNNLLEDWMFKLQESRPDWDHYFMNIAEAVKLRCSCMSSKKGAIIVREKQIISTGYNGTPRRTGHCTEGHCKRCTLRHQGKIKSADYNSAICICAHAEENAIVQAAHNGTSTKGATLYTTFTPCNMCARMIINAGIKEVVAKVTYPDDVGRNLLKEAGVKLRVLR